MKGVLLALVCAVALVAVYVERGGGDYEPRRPPDPCTARPAQGRGGGVTGGLERVGLNALNGAACELGISRERLLLGLTGEEELGVDDERRTDAFRNGLRTALDEEERAGRIGGTQAFLLRQGIEVLPIDAVLDQLFGSGG